LPMLSPFDSLDSGSLWFAFLIGISIRTQTKRINWFLLWCARVILFSRSLHSSVYTNSFYAIALI